MAKKIIIFSILIFACITQFINYKDNNKLDSIKINSTVYSTENEFNKLGYSNDDINLLKEKYNVEQINIILSKGIKKAKLFSYLKYSNFKFEKFDEYEKLRKNDKLSYLESINTINHPYIISDFYRNVQDAINIDNNLILVNKNYYLNNNYVPNDLIYAQNLNLLIPSDITRNLVRQEVYENLTYLFNDAKRRGLYLYLSNGYRSYDRQARIYNEYLIEGSEADLFSARPGHSEHQTGLAVDLTSKSVNFLLIKEFEDTLEGKYVVNNAHKFGFIVRYPKEKEHITGYTYEPWHLRYVGKEAASIIYQNKLTLEEYLLKYTEIPIK